MNWYLLSITSLIRLLLTSIDFPVKQDYREMDETEKLTKGAQSPLPSV